MLLDPSPEAIQLLKYALLYRVPTFKFTQKNFFLILSVVELVWGSGIYTYLGKSFIFFSIAAKGLFRIQSNIYGGEKLHHRCLNGF